MTLSKFTKTGSDLLAYTKDNSPYGTAKYTKNTT